MEKKVYFYLTLLLLSICIGTLVLYFYLPRKTYDNTYFGIDDYHSTIDKDEDGIEDQTDILESVFTYIRTNPKYKSKYYSTGYPDDSYGVCTDVVAFGLLGAGYDIKELMYLDIKENKEIYEIETIDKNIDFRRVKNMDTYFKRNSISLSLNPYSMEEWQGGDIVVFKRHIGIISSKRNKKGIPYVIHHANPYQKEYEEDILEGRTDIIGHYRIS